MSEILLLLTAVFVSSSVLIFLLDRYSHPYLPAYIGAGLIVGYFIEPTSFYSIAEIGIAFLVFIFGLKLEPERLKSVARESQAMTTVQVSIVALSTYTTGLLIGLDMLDAIYISIAASLSSSLIGMQLVNKEIEIELLHGRLAESTQLVQDLIAITAVIALNSIYSNSNTIIIHALLGVGLLAAAGLIRRYVFSWIAEGIDEDRELMVLTSLSFLTGFIAISQYLGLSTVVGAFAAGIAISKFPYNIEVVDTMEPLKDFFSVLFFVSIGALIVFPSLKTVIIAAVLLFFSQLVKPAVAVTVLVKQGYDKRTAHLTGANIDQISEFALIIAIQAFISGLLSQDAFQGIILAASASFLISSYTSRHGEKIHEKLKWFEPFPPSNKKIKEKSSVEGLEDHVVLVGYDTQGKIIAEALKDEGAEFVVIENNPDKINEAQENEDNYVFGDAMDDSTWEKASYRDASMIVSTVPLEKTSEKIVDLETDADKIVRTDSMWNASEYVKDTAYVEVPDLLASERLADHIHGVLEDPNYREELRRRNLLEIRRLLNEQEE
ncbi:MAG: cation:proton antiporter [Candidatus Nanohalobium sp.]